MGDLDNTTTKAKRRRNPLTVVVDAEIDDAAFDQFVQFLAQVVARDLIQNPERAQNGNAEAV